MSQLARFLQKNTGIETIGCIKPVLRIRRIRMFLGLLDLDPLVRYRAAPASDTSIIKQK